MIKPSQTANNLFEPKPGRADAIFVIQINLCLDRFVQNSGDFSQTQLILKSHKQ